MDDDRQLRMPDSDHPEADQFYAERVLVTGDRHWENWPVIREELFNCAHMRVLIHGDCQSGADRIAREMAPLVCEDVEIIAYPADWNHHGLAAGPIRNRRMRDEAKPDFVLAFHSDITKSKGTKNMVFLAREAGIPVKIVTGIPPSKES